MKTGKLKLSMLAILILSFIPLLPAQTPDSPQKQGPAPKQNLATTPKKKTSQSVAQETAPGQQNATSTPTPSPSPTLLFKVSDENLKFSNQLVNTYSAPQVVTITNTSGKPLSPDFLVIGDFSESHTACQTLNAGASCPFSVTFSPKHSGPITGSVVISAKLDNSTATSKTISLTGAGTQQCDPIGFQWGLASSIVLILCGVYFVGFVLVRWNLIARPARLQLRTQIMAVQSRLNAELAAMSYSSASEGRKKQIEDLLKAAIYLVKTKTDPFDIWNQNPLPRYTRYSNALFWTRGHELAGWSLVHEAEEQLVALLPSERVRARMETAEQQLRQMINPSSLALADRLRDAMQQGSLANTLWKLSDFLHGLISWLETSTNPASVLEGCNKSLTEFQQKFAGASALQREISTSLQQWPAMPMSEQAILQSAVNFLTGQFANVYRSAGTQADLTACNAILATLAQLQEIAQPMAHQLAVIMQPPQDVLERWRALLIEALGQIYDRADTDFAQLAHWHNKIMWLAASALFLIAALAITFHNPVVLLLGAVGGLLSRLNRNLQAADVENDYGASWGSLFLSPVTGALSAWGGILLIILAKQLNILGSALSLEWCNPFDPLTLGMALLFGFSERLFDQIAEQIDKKILSPASSPTTTPPPKTPTPAPATPSSGSLTTTASPSSQTSSSTSATSAAVPTVPASAAIAADTGPSTSTASAPTITGVDPLPATAGKQNKLNVHGTNFKSGAAASFTDEAGKAVATNATVEFKDTATLVVTFTPPAATTASKLTLKITNPDGSTAILPTPIQVNP